VGFSWWGLNEIFFLSCLAPLEENKMQMQDDERAPAVRFFVFMGDNGEPALGESEKVLHTLDSVELAFRPETPVGRGRLVVTSSRVLWIGEQYACDFSVPRIALHAMTRDEDSYRSPCLYCQLDMDEVWDDAEEEESNSEGEDEEDEANEVVEQGGDGIGVTNGKIEVEVESEVEAKKNSVAVAWEDSCLGEVYLAPSDEAQLRPLFDAFSQAALLNPDVGDDEAGDLMYDPAEAAHALEGLQLLEGLDDLSEQQAAALDHWESVFVCPEGGTERTSGPS
jgi:hypothetical protein